MKEGVTVILRNAKIDMFKGSMRLAVDKWGRVELAEAADFVVKEDNNLSLVEYELVNVIDEWGHQCHKPRSSGRKGSREIPPLKARPVFQDGDKEYLTCTYVVSGNARGSFTFWLFCGVPANFPQLQWFLKFLLWFYPVSSPPEPAYKSMINCAAICSYFLWRYLCRGEFLVLAIHLCTEVGRLLNFGF